MICATPYIALAAVHHEAKQIAGRPPSGGLPTERIFPCQIQRLQDQRALSRQQGALRMHEETPLVVLRDVDARCLRRAAPVEITQMIRVDERAVVMLVVQHDEFVLGVLAN